jgi:hypothetical protein
MLKVLLELVVVERYGGKLLTVMDRNPCAALENP